MQKTQCNGSSEPICCGITTVTDVYDQAVSLSSIQASDKLEIGLVVSGNGMHQIMNQTVPCKENDIFLIPAHIPHGYFTAENGGILQLRRMQIDLAAFYSDGTEVAGEQRFCFGVFRDDSVTAYAMLNSRTRAEINQFFDRISDEISEKKQEWIAAVSANLSLMLITLCRYVNSAIRNDQAFPPKEWRIVSSAIRMVTERFQESDLTLESISGALYISKSQLSRVFSKLVGEQFSEYLRRVRISHACRLLQYTDVTVDEIVARCGLKDIPSFYRNFQLLVGMTPSQYRHGFVTSQSSSETKITSALEGISEAIVKGDAKKVTDLVSEALRLEVSSKDVLDALLSGMNTVGERFMNNRVYVPEVLVASRAMNKGIQVLRPILLSEGVKPIGRACIGTVQGDLHDIGKNLVKMMMEGRGIEVIDLGTDVSADEFIDAAKEQKCSLICCSALLTTTMGVMKEVVEKADAAGIRPRVKIMLGGAPVSEAYCKQIGADAYTNDAAAAAEMAEKIILNLTKGDNI